MTIFDKARGLPRVVSGVVCGAAVVALGAFTALTGGERVATQPVAPADIAGLTSAPAPARSMPIWSGGSPSLSEGRLQRINDAGNVPTALPPLESSVDNDSRTFQCLATAIYYEARGEGHDGMAAVAQVILNRARHPLFPRSVCGVVYQPRQFSFVGAGLRAPYGHLWAQARDVAERALGGHVMTRVGTSTHFHATRVRPSWSGLRRVATIGQHVFYAYADRRGSASAFRATPDLDEGAAAPVRREYARVRRSTEALTTAPADAATVAPAPSIVAPADSAPALGQSAVPAPAPADAPLATSAAVA